MLICLYVTDEQPVYNNICVAWVYILGCDFMPLKCFLDYDKINFYPKEKIFSIWKSRKPFLKIKFHV